MKIICKQEINGAKIYDIRIITAISLAVVTAGFLIMLTYNNIYIRYGLLLAVLIAAFIKRNYLKATILGLLNRKQE